jgi:hypothetical protein
MASQYVQELRELENLLRDEGWDRRANIVGNAADRMEHMEELILQMQADLNLAQ